MKDMQPDKNKHSAMLRMSKKTRWQDKTATGKQPESKKQSQNQPEDELL